MRGLKIISLIVLKKIGGFHLSWFLNKRKLRILGYHGFSIDNQYRFEDILFMRKETFERRMKILKRWNMNVIPLDEAVEKLPEDKHPNHGVVITFDDGWYSTIQALPTLQKYNYPATIYVSSYYSLKSTNVFNILMRYLFWETTSTSLHIENCHPAIDGRYDLTDKEQKNFICSRIIKYGYVLDLATREKLAKQIATELKIDLGEIESKRMFQYLNIRELNELKKHGVSCELHTHRHQFPLNHDHAEKEISENRTSLNLVENRTYSHFCYPSGIYSKGQFPLLRKLGIKSATTTKKGLNSSSTSLYELSRFLDRETVSDLEFEADICGLTDLLKIALLRRA